MFYPCFIHFSSYILAKSFYKKYMKGIYNCTIIGKSIGFDGVSKECYYALRDMALKYEIFAKHKSGGLNLLLIIKKRLWSE